MHVKRRSSTTVDRAEDAAPAIIGEEGMAGALAKRSIRLPGVPDGQAVDDESIGMLTTVLEDLEVASIPAWLWRRALAQGFEAMRSLAARSRRVPRPNP